MEKICVIVPVYNMTEYVCRCIDSVLDQTYDNFTLLLIDDGSTDNSGQICDQYKLKDNRIIVKHTGNNGVSAARNSGIEFAIKNGYKWLTFIDSDDWIHPMYIELLLKTSLNTNSSICICNYCQISEYKKSDEPFDIVIKEINTEMFYISNKINAVVPWAKLYKTSLFSDVRFPIGKRYEDEMTTYKVLFKKDNIVYIDYPLYFYYNNPTGFMNSQWSDTKLDVIDLFDDLLIFFKNNGLEKAYNERLIDYYQNIEYILKIIPKKIKYYSTIKELIEKKRNLKLRLNKNQKIRILNEKHPTIMLNHWRLKKIIKIFLLKKEVGNE